MKSGLLILLSLARFDWLENLEPLELLGDNLEVLSPNPSFLLFNSEYLFLARAHARAFLIYMCRGEEEGMWRLRIFDTTPSAFA